MNAATSRILILDEERIARKIVRMAWQIFEHNSSRASVTLIGIADGGAIIAQKLAGHLRDISPLAVTVARLDLDKKSPAGKIANVNGPVDDKSIVLVDDVANSGRTLLYALQALLDKAPEQILIAVLVDRKHKSFPITPDIIGHQVATTIQGNIVVQLDGGGMKAFLE